jgi:hypothetical protein
VTTQNNLKRQICIIINRGKIYINYNPYADASMKRELVSSVLLEALFCYDIPSSSRVLALSFLHNNNYNNKELATTLF